MFNKSGCDRTFPFSNSQNAIAAALEAALAAEEERKAKDRELMAAPGPQVSATPNDAELSLATVSDGRVRPSLWL